MMSRRRAVPVRQQRAPFIFFVFFCVHKGRLASQTGFRRGYNGFFGSNNGALGEGAARLLVDESSPVFAGCPGWTGDAVRRLSTLVREATLRDGQRSAVLEGCERAETQTRMRAGRPLST